MIKPNWANFLTKFNDNPQKYFEWFCYLLFCQEFNKTAGIFRFKNQSGIETNPIINDSEVIGWQAKFYDTKLSDHKKELVETVTKSKRDYPNLTNIIFYTNQEWGQGKKGNEPLAKKEVEKKADSLNIKIEWRTTSFFEAPFVSIDNEIIAKHFFTPDRSIFDVLEEKRRHTENVLLGIHTAIYFNDKKIEIDRSELIKRLRDDLSQKQILVINGIGGVGKTAVIKKLHETLKGDVPFYVFKASEFNRNNINDLFGEYTLQDFIDAHKDEINKVVIIDSAEKLLDLSNTDPFKEFLAVLIKCKWQIIFTSRNNYLEDLNYQFIEIYQITPGNFDVQNLNKSELIEISQTYNFNLPEDGKLLELIKNPFYLNEYLKFYTGENIDYVNFKENLWSRIITKSNPAREHCFLATAFQRANEGQFYVTPSCDSQILNMLVNDGILGHETAGYFITHDIYEEWALEKKIASDYIRKVQNKEFFEQIGGALPVRRSFRNWVSERLLLEDESIRQFILEIIPVDNITPFWKDELWISVLLSEHSATFFELFKEELLSNEQALLKRLAFMLRLACMEIDNDFLKQLGVVDLNLLSIKFVQTKPKGSGWQSAIRFIHDNLDNIGIKNIHFSLPLIYEWNRKSKRGETTRSSSLIALTYYQWSIEEDVHLSRGDDKENLLQTILHGASEIKTELEGLFGEVLKNKWDNHRDPYYDLMKIILTDLEAIPVWVNLPDYVLQVADLFWFSLPHGKHEYLHDRMDIEEEFCLTDDHHDYFPSSPYQTPIYWLLQLSLQKTVDFILTFTNKTVEYFAKSRFAVNEIEETTVYINNEESVRQYICNRLWCMYRGTQVSTQLLESIHMALEKYFLENGKNVDSKTLESWLLYLLKTSKSSSISAVVASIVLAYPEKTFNVAKILFQTKDFFFYDTNRLCLDQTQKSSLLMLKNSFGGGNYKNAIHEEERIKSCDEPHRQMALEHLALKYQLFRSEETGEEEAQARQQAIWDIFDKYYSELPDQSEEDDDKTWRLFLARMDRRKIKVTTEVTDDGVLINFNPEIDPKLKEYSEEALKKNSEPMKYMPLRLWASYKKDRDERYKQYEQYENSPQLALKEVEEIIDRLKQGEDESFRLFNHAIPGDVCSILMADCIDKLSAEERSYCKDVILDYARVPIMPNYHYQISDGTASAISALPTLLQNYPDERKSIKVILLLTLFKDSHIHMGGGHYSVFPTRAINKLWESHFDDMQSLLIGYLLLKPKYVELREKLRQESYNKGHFENQEGQLHENFFKEHEHDLKRVMENTISIDDLSDMTQTDLYILNTAFQLIPLKTSHAGHKELAKSIIATFANDLLSHKREDKVDYEVRHSFLKKLAYIVLNSSEKDIPDYLKPFLDNFNGSEAIAELFEEFILAEDSLDTYDKFWQVWNLFSEKMVVLCKDGDGYWYADRIIKSYLFAQTIWKETATDWHSFKDSNSKFFNDIAKNIGHCPSTLYSLSKSLNNIAGRYLNSGISWLSGMVSHNKNLWTAKLATNTLYYLENLVRKYIYKEREKIRKTKKLKEEVLIILDFLIERGSVVGYILRENIL